MRLLVPDHTGDLHTYDLLDKPWALTTDANAIRAEVLAAPAVTGRRAPRLLPWRAKNGASHFLLVNTARARVRLNGRRPLPVAALQHQDELTINGQAAYFSAESLPQAAEFKQPTEEEPIYCSRCRDKLKDGEDAVQCPRCRLWYHYRQDPSRCCWRYARKCSSCDHPTREEFLWKPQPIPQDTQENLSYEERRHKRQHEAALRTAQ